MLWIIRFILLGVLGASVCVDPYLYRHRSRYERLVENRIFNITVVIVWNCLCYLIVGLPPAGGWNLRPDWLEYQSVRIGFPVIGLLLICAGALLGFATLKQRKVIGIQDVKQGLLTSGAYRYFRHPIGTAIIWISLGLPLVMRNPDGLLMFPAIFVIHFAAEIMEERYDVGVRFREQYQAYRRTTRMFGPIWLWSILIAMLLLLVGLGLNIKNMQADYNIKITSVVTSATELFAYGTAVKLSEQTALWEATRGETAVSFECSIENC